MTRAWLAIAAWSSLCALAFSASALGLAAAFVVLGLAPLALIGWLVGPSANMNLGAAVPYLLGWTAAMALAVGVAVYAWRRAGAAARAMAAGLNGPTRLPAWSAVVTGVLAAWVVANVLGVAFAGRLGLQARAPAPAAARPASPEEVAAFRALWKPRAEAGEAYAQFVVGAAMSHGALGQPVDRRNGRRWLEKAAAQGDPDAELSLLVADSGGHDGQLIDSGAIRRLPALADRAEGWRRVALELVVSQNPRIGDAGTVPPPPPEREKWVRAWLEKAARGGSRFAAIELARSFEDQRDLGGTPAPDLPSAARWYAAAGASAEMLRLRTESSASPAAASSLATAEASATGLVPPRPAAPDAQLERLARRVDLLSASAAPTELERQDALAHRIVLAEATHRYALVGDAAASMPVRLTIDRDRSRALLFRRLAADEADTGSSGKPQEQTRDAAPR